MNNEQTTNVADATKQQGQQELVAAAPKKWTWKRIAIYSGVGLVATAAGIGAALLMAKKPEVVAAAADAVTSA